MFGIGPQELILVALLVLLIFGPHKASSVTRDVGRFVHEIRHPVEELKSDLASVGERRNDRAGNDVAGDRRCTSGPSESRDSRGRWGLAREN
jgi:Sec-independent protein translocase protein TatA